MILLLGYKDKARRVSVGSGVRPFANYSKCDKVPLVNGLKLDEVKLDKFSVLIGHGYMQVAGAGWNEDHALNYHIHLIPESRNLTNVVALSYDDLLQPRSRIYCHLTDIHGDSSSANLGEVGAAGEEEGHENKKACYDGGSPSSVTHTRLASGMDDIQVN